MKNFGKNLLIAFLMILAIYQTTELWFEQYSSHNFFSFLSTGTNDISQADLYGLDRLIISLGDNQVISRRENVLDTNYRNELDKLLAQTINKGEATSGQINWSSLFNNRCVIYDFTTPIKITDFRTALDIDNRLLSDMHEINLAVIVPNTTEKMVQVYLSNNDRTNCYTLKKSESAQKGSEFISEFKTEEREFSYISSRGNGFNIFDENVFIPVPQQQRNTINVINPVMTEDKIDTKVLENAVNGFFDNPAVKWSSVVNNVYSYSDENNVVRYNLNGVLEYSGYSTNTSGTQDLMQAYQAAVAFLKKDTSIRNDITLTDISLQQDKMVFCFDYSIKNVRTPLSAELKKGLQLNSAIEVTVSGGSVVRYRRYMCELVESSVLQGIKSDFVNAVDNVYNNLDDNEATVDDIDLVYVINGRGNNVALSWQVEIDGTIYLEAA